MNILQRFFDVQQADSTANSTISDVIGNKSDKSFSNGNATPSLAGHLRAAYYHVHSPAVAYPRAAAPKTVTDKDDGGSTPWGFGTIVEIIPAATITTKFDIHHVIISEISEIDDYELRLYKGPALSEEEIGAIAFSRSTNFAEEGSHPIQVEPQAANTRISAALASADADGAACNIKFYVHTYPDIT